jgi:hypothetical protein
MMHIVTTPTTNFLGTHVEGHTFVATRAVMDSLTQAQIQGLLARHLARDWSEMSFAEDIEANRKAVEHGNKGGERFRVMSVYDAPTGSPEPQVWVITDYGWEVTTVLWPSDY